MINRDAPANESTDATPQNRENNGSSNVKDIRIDVRKPGFSHIDFYPNCNDLFNAIYEESQ